MTTTVTVKTAKHPARVLEFPCRDGQPEAEGEWRQLAELKPHSQQVFAAHAHADILVQELEVE